MKNGGNPPNAIDIATTLNGGEGSWTASIAPTWHLFTEVPHGGVTAALLINAAKQLDPDRAVRTFTGYLMAPLLGEIEVTATKVRETRSLSTVQVTASVGGKIAATATAVFGSRLESTTRQDFAVAPAVPRAEDCPDVVSAAGDFFPRFIREHIDFRPALGVPFSSGKSPELAGWVRMRESRPFDDLTVAVLLDALPSAISVLADGMRIAPTVEYSIAFDQNTIAAVDGSDWILAHARNWSAGDGWSFEDADLFSRDGVLLARGRQLRRLPF